MLNQQASTQQAAAIVAQTVATQIGNYANRQKQAAEAAGDQDTADKWKEGGAYRIAMHIAGGAAVAGLGGGSIVSAAQGAAGAGISAAAAGKLNELSEAIATSSATGNANADKALGNIIANVIATGAGAAVGGGSGAMTASNADLYNRQLHPDERKWTKDNAKRFADFYKDQTGQTLTADQAQQMLLASGYRMVDAAASAGPAPDGSKYATAFISQNAGSMFAATAAEYKNPFLYGSQDGALTPEQRALPGAVANPKLGLAIAGALAAPAVLPALATIPGAPIFGIDGALGSSTWASPLGIGAITGTVNATSQYIQNGSVNPVDVAYAGIGGAGGMYGGFFWNVGLNAITGAADTATNNALSGKNDSIVTGAAANAGAAAIGFKIGAGAQSIAAGSSGANWFIPNNLPNIIAGFFGAAGAESGAAGINAAKTRVGK